jgi:hypothetical protein
MACAARSSVSSDQVPPHVQAPRRWTTPSLPRTRGGRRRTWRRVAARSSPPGVRRTSVVEDRHRRHRDRPLASLANSAVTSRHEVASGIDGADRMVKLRAVDLVRHEAEAARSWSDARYLDIKIVWEGIGPSAAHPSGRLRCRRAAPQPDRRRHLRRRFAGGSSTTSAPGNGSPVAAHPVRSGTQGLRVPPGCATRPDPDRAHHSGQPLPSPTTTPSDTRSLICDEFQDTDDEWQFLQAVAPDARRILLGDVNSASTRR